MIGRAGLGRPWLFRQAEAAPARRADPAGADAWPSRSNCSWTIIGLVVEQFGPEKGTILMRRYACCYAQGRQGPGRSAAKWPSVATAGEFLGVVGAVVPAVSGAADW